MRPACFIVPGRLAAEPPPAAGTCLDDRHANALALLIPLLGCGEEAAALAFDGLADNARDRRSAVILKQIGREERVHDALLRSLMCALPAPPDRPAMMRRAQRLHVELGSGGSAIHLARIAALDAAVCIVLSRLLRRGRPLCADTNVWRTLGRIHSDEARHVRWSRYLALAAGPTVAQRNAAAGAREALAKVLMLAGDAFETLDVDPFVLERDIRRLPDGLLAP